MKSSRGRRAETRVLAAGAALLAVYVGLVVAYVPWSSVSSDLGASSSGATALVTQRPGDVSLAVGPSAKSSPTTVPSASSPMPAPTAQSTPRPYRAAAAPTPDQRRLYHVPILMYHRIVPVEEAGDSMPHLVVPPATFAIQMQAFSDAGWHSITMATLARYMETGAAIPAKTFVITFDDGWSDGYDYAFPIMRRFGFVGTFYVIGDRIGIPEFLSAPQLRTLEAAGNDIGNHTEDHVSLPGNSESRVISQVENASQEIERAVGHRPVSLAYPMGGFDQFVADIVSRIPDIKIAVTTLYGAEEMWPSRLYTPRVRVNPSTDGRQLVAELTAP